jgi:mono/diheme cytochrome c family protein
MHCAGCHQIDKQGGAVGPELSAFADKDPGSFDYTHITGGHSKQAWVVEHFKNPKKVTPGSPMHIPTLNDYQVECLSSYVLTLSQREFTRQYTAKVRADFVPPKVDILVPETDLPGGTDDEAASK